MPYDVTAIATCVAVLVKVLWDGQVSKIEAYMLMVCCLVLGATSFVTNFLQSTVFSAGINPYVVAFALAFLIIWKGPGGKTNAYLLGVCALILGSTALVTDLLPPLVNGLFDMISSLLAKGF